MFRKRREQPPAWWNEEEGAAYRELCRKFANDEITVARFEAEAGNLVKAAADREGVDAYGRYRDIFAPLTLADNPPSTDAERTSPPATRSSNEPSLAPRQTEQPRPPSAQRPQVQNASASTRVQDARMAATHREAVRLREQLSGQEEQERRYRGLVASWETEADEQAFRSSGRGFITPQSLCFDSAGGLWVRRPDISSKRRKDQPNIAVMLMSDGSVTIAPIDAPPRPRRGTSSPEIFRGGDWMAVGLRTRARVAAERAAEYERLKNDSTERKAADKGLSLSSSPSQELTRGPESRPTAQTEEELTGHLRDLVRYHAAGLIHGDGLVSLKGWLEDYDRGVISFAQLLERFPVTQDRVDRYTKQVKAFTAREDAEFERWLATKQVDRVRQLLASHQRGGIDAEELFERTLGDTRWFPRPERGEAGRLLSLIEDHWRGLIGQDELFEKAKRSLSA